MRIYTEKGFRDYKSKNSLEIMEKMEIVTYGKSIICIIYSESPLNINDKIFLFSDSLWRVDTTVNII